MVREKQKTREQLVIEVARLQKDNEEWATLNTDRKKEFAKAFGLYTDKERYSGTRELRDITWVEIFVEVGKLLSTQQKFNYVEGMNKLSSDNSFLMQKFQEIDSFLKNPKKKRSGPDIDMMREIGLM